MHRIICTCGICVGNILYQHYISPIDYANFGSDIGGYRSGSGVLGRTKELLIRWAQLGAFSPLMENGGDKEHRPWEFDNTNQTLDIYTKYGTEGVIAVVDYNHLE